MIRDGLMDRFAIDEVYGMHNRPGLPVGQFAIRTGPIMASADTLEIAIEGVGGHAARPHLAVDTVLVGAQIVNAIQCPAMSTRWRRRSCRSVSSRPAIPTT